MVPSSSHWNLCEVDKKLTSIQSCLAMETKKGPTHHGLHLFLLVNGRQDVTGLSLSLGMGKCSWEMARSPSVFHSLPKVGEVATEVPVDTRYQRR